MKVFKNLYKKLFGELVYVVTIESIYGERSIYEVNDIKIIHEQVNELNEFGEYVRGEAYVGKNINTIIL